MTMSQPSIPETSSHVTPGIHGFLALCRTVVKKVSVGQRGHPGARVADDGVGRGDARTSDRLHPGEHPVAPARPPGPAGRAPARARPAGRLGRPAGALFGAGLALSWIIH